MALTVPEYAHHLLLVVSLMLAYRGVASLIKIESIKRWREQPGKVAEMHETFEDVFMTPYFLTKYYYPEVVYEYDVDGRTCTGNRVGYDVKSIWVPEIGEWGDPTS